MKTTEAKRFVELVRGQLARVPPADRKYVADAARAGRRLPPEHRVPWTVDPRAAPPEKRQRAVEAAIAWMHVPREWRHLVAPLAVGTDAMIEALFGDLLR